MVCCHGGSVVCCIMFSLLDPPILQLVFGPRSILIEFGEAYYVAQPVTVPLGIYFIMQVQVLRQVGQSAD